MRKKLAREPFAEKICKVAQLIRLAKDFPRRSRQMMRTEEVRKHTADPIASDAWDRPGSREGASRTGTVAKSLHNYRFRPPVVGVDNVFGDRNLVCSCVGMENHT